MAEGLSVLDCRYMQGVDTLLVLNTELAHGWVWVRVCELRTDDRQPGGRRYLAAAPRILDTHSGGGVAPSIRVRPVPIQGVG